MREKIDWEIFLGTPGLTCQETVKIFPLISLGMAKEIQVGLKGRARGNARDDRNHNDSVLTVECVKKCLENFLANFRVHVPGRLENCLSHTLRIVEGNRVRTVSLRARRRAL